VYQALVLGVRDYVGKNGFPGAILGLSGGIDSALTLAVAVDAIGADKVKAIMMPSEFTASMSLEDAEQAGREPGREIRRAAHQAHVRHLPGRAVRRVRRPALRPDRGEHPGPGARRPAHGPVQQVRAPGAHHRQQERDGQRLRHPLRRHGRRLRRAQGRGQDPGLAPVPLPQLGVPGDPGAHHHPSAQRRAARQPVRPGQPAALRDPRRHHGTLRGTGHGAPGDRGGRASRGGRAPAWCASSTAPNTSAGNPPPASASRRAASAATGAIPSPTATKPPFEPIPARSPHHEEDRSHHQAVQAGRGARSAARWASAA
jgi:hypothetical protein